MLKHLTHKIELRTNNVQSNHLSKSTGTSRFGFNLALDLWNKEYALGNKPTMYSIKKSINSIKPQWSYEVSKCCIESSIIDLGRAFNNFFNNPKKFCHPTFKTKGRRDSFRLDNSKFKVDSNYLKIAKLKTPIKMTEALRFTGKLISCTVSRTANKWFASITVEIENPKNFKTNREPRFVGVDLGIKTLAVLSDGVEFEGVKPHKNLLLKLRRLNKSLSRKTKGSQNFKKSKVKLGLLHYRIACIRKDYLHKLTTYLVDNYDVITIEDLNTKGMVKNHCLARSIMDMGWGMFKELLNYKCPMNNVGLIKADRFFPSTKMCSGCGQIKDMKLGQRVYKCDCGLSLDRDLNASINLMNYGRIAVGLTVKACGLESSDTIHRMKLSKVKQESNINSNNEFSKN